MQDEGLLPPGRSPGRSTGTPSYAEYSAGSNKLVQEDATQPQLAQLLLVYQWTAALYRIWPSSTPDAKGLHKLLTEALKGGTQLMMQLSKFVMQMQTAQQSPSCSTGSNAGHQHEDCAVSNGAPAGSTTQSAQLPMPAAQTVQGPTKQQGQDSARRGWLSKGRLDGPVAAAVLEMAAIVLEPLGLILQQEQQLAQRQGYPMAQLHNMSSTADDLADKLQYYFGEKDGGTPLLLHTMLSACLHQLVLHVESLLGQDQGCTQLPTSSSQQQGVSSGSSACCAAEVGSSSSSGGGRSIAELAEGYLLQHADILQAEKPVAPSKTAVTAWRAVCERLWAVLSLPLTLQEATAVLASMQPSAAAASSSGGDGSACTAAVAFPAMEDCDALHGSFRVCMPAQNQRTKGSPRGCQHKSQWQLQREQQCQQLQHFSPSA